MNHTAHFTAWRNKEQVHYNIELELEVENTTENAKRVADNICQRINDAYNVKRCKLKSLHLDGKQVWPEENLEFNAEEN